MTNAFHDAHDDHAEGDDSAEITAPAWSVFGDLMAGLVGAFVLVFIGVLLTQVDLVNSLQAEVRVLGAAYQALVVRKGRRLRAQRGKPDGGR